MIILVLKFYILTHQKSLKHLLEQRIITLDQQKWVSKLLGYDYEIRYKPQKENNVANALFRIDGSLVLNALFVPQTTLWDTIKAVAAADPYM